MALILMQSKACWSEEVVSDDDGRAIALIFSTRSFRIFNSSFLLARLSKLYANNKDIEYPKAKVRDIVMAKSLNRSARATLFES